MKIKRLIIPTLVLVFMFCLSGCGNAPKKSDKVSVVCTNFAVYDWVNRITDCGDAEGLEIILLNGNGDIHSFQPTAQDITKIQTCDLFVYIGGESDVWAEKIVKDNNINHLKLFDVLKEDLICGTHNHDHKQSTHEHSASDYDEHIWLSPKLAAKSITAISEKLVEFAPEIDENNNGKDAVGCFLKNTTGLEIMCENLDKEYKQAVLMADREPIVFADRFPFGYLTHDYGIECVAAFPGCSADQDASFEVIVRLAKTVDEYDKKAVLVLENSSQTVAKTVIENTKNKNAEILVINSCQTMDEKDFAQGASYFDIMEENLAVLKKALQ